MNDKPAPKNPFLQSMSTEQIGKVKPITDEQIRDALNKGKRERDEAERWLYGWPGSYR